MNIEIAKIAKRKTDNRYAQGNHGKSCSLLFVWANCAFLLAEIAKIDDGKDATCFMYFSKEEIYHGYGCKKQHECSFRAQHFKH